MFCEIKIIFFKIKILAPLLNQSSLVYKLTCPGCSSSYVSKTEITLFERTEEHAYPSQKKNDQSEIFQHLSSCTHYDHKSDLFNLNINDVHRKKFDVYQIRDNTIVLDRCNNWHELFKEALMVKKHCPTLSTVSRASKELQLF